MAPSDAHTNDKWSQEQEFEEWRKGQLKLKEQLTTLEGRVQVVDDMVKAAISETRRLEDTLLYIPLGQVAKYSSPFVAGLTLWISNWEMMMPLLTQIAISAGAGAVSFTAGSVLINQAIETQAGLPVLLEEVKETIMKEKKEVKLLGQQAMGGLVRDYSDLFDRLNGMQTRIGFLENEIKRKKLLSLGQQRIYRLNNEEFSRKLREARMVTQW